MSDTHSSTEDSWVQFIDELDDFTPTKSAGYHLYQKPLPKPRPLFLEIPDEEKLPGWVDPINLDQMSKYIKSSYHPRYLKNLRRGKYRCNSELDLHGYSRDQARVALDAFLSEAISYDDECVCIIVGRGKGSKNQQAVLPAFVKSWLMQDERIIAFCEAPANQGGSGALFVLVSLKKAS